MHVFIIATCLETKGPSSGEKVQNMQNNSR